MLQVAKKKEQSSVAIKNYKTYRQYENVVILKIAPFMKGICPNYFKAYGCMYNGCDDCCMNCVKRCNKYQKCRYFDVVVLEELVKVEGKSSAKRKTKGQIYLSKV